MTAPYMSDAERARVVRLLQQTRDDFLATVEPVTDAQWDFRPEPDRWSIGLIAEHLGLVERGLFGRVERALDMEANPDWQSATTEAGTTARRRPIQCFFTLTENNKRGK